PVFRCLTLGGQRSPLNGDLVRSTQRTRREAVIVQLDKWASGRMLSTCTENLPTMKRPFVTCAHRSEISIGESDDMSHYAVGRCGFARRPSGKCRRAGLTLSG